MNKFLKTILITLIAAFGAGILSVPAVFAQDNNLVVEFEQIPLFSEANFLPGQGVTRWVKVTNNSGRTQRIATEAINKSDPNRLGDVLELEIKEGGSRLYKDAFSKFFATGEVYLSDLANNSTTTYDFIVTFYSGAGDPFQGKNLSFDLLVGFQGTEGGLLPGAGSGPWPGGFSPPGLTIQNESIKLTSIEETSVTIIWTTSHKSTSQVIYAKEGESHTLDLNDHYGTPPKYGYERTTPEYDVSPKVIPHSVTITGLTPNTEYYFRTVSHASFAVSGEHSFTTKEKSSETLETTPPEELNPEISEVSQSASAPQYETGQKSVLRFLERVVEKITKELENKETAEGANEIKEETAGISPEKKSSALVDESPEKFDGRGLLAALGKLTLGWKFILILLVVIASVLITLWLSEKRKKERHD